MIIAKIERGSIPSEEVTMQQDYYIVDAKTLETIAYMIESCDLDAVSETCNRFVIEMEKVKYEYK